VIVVRIRVGDAQTLGKYLFIQKPLSIKNLVRKIDERINGSSMDIMKIKH